MDIVRAVVIYVLIITILYLFISIMTMLLTWYELRYTKDNHDKIPDKTFWLVYNCPDYEPELPAA